MSALRSFIVSLAIGVMLHFSVFWLGLIGASVALKYSPISKSAGLLLLLSLLYLSSSISGALLSITKDVVKPLVVVPIATALACIASFFVLEAETVFRESDLSFIVYALIPAIAISTIVSLVVSLVRTAQGVHR